MGIVFHFKPNSCILLKYSSSFVGFYLVGMCLSNVILSNFFLCIVNSDFGIFLADILVLYTEMRPIITIDYGGKMPELHEQLCALMKIIQKVLICTLFISSIHL